MKWSNSKLLLVISICVVCVPLILWRELQYHYRWDWSPCSVGTRFESYAPDGGNWHPFNTAPTDGTIIETKNVYGVAPSYFLFAYQTASGETDPRWVNVLNNRIGISDDHGYWFMYWRSFLGDLHHYVDPTRGRQNTDEYWRCAAIKRAASYGVPRKTNE